MRHGSILKSYAAYANSRQKRNLLRVLPTGNAHPALLDFSASDYLGLSQHPDVVQAAQDAAFSFGTSGRSSRLFNTGLPLYEALEREVAASLGMPASLVFISGYQANVACLSALLDPLVLGDQPLVFSDRLNHASLHHGCRLAQVQQLRYRHTDLSHLEDLLKAYRASPRPKFILTETVFSMDGDGPSVASLMELAARENAFLFLDDAHAIGIMGKNGYGLAANLPPEQGLIMGTFSKGVGTSGAYVAGAQSVLDYLVNAAGGFIYSTAPSPSVIGATQAAWKLLPTLESLRTQIQHTSTFLRERLRAQGWNVGSSGSHIIPLILGDVQNAMDLQYHLHHHGIHTAAARYPTVPLGSARLRLACHARLTRQDCEHFLEALLSTYTARRTAP